MKAWKTRYGNAEIDVTNSLATATLQVNGKTQDLYWGLFASQVRLYGSLECNGSSHEIKAVLGPKLFTWHCAVFVDDEMVFNSAEPQQVLIKE